MTEYGGLRRLDILEGPNPCAYCCRPIFPGFPPLCYYHVVQYGPESRWHIENRIYCDFIHRKKLWTPVPEKKIEPTENFHGHVYEAPVERAWANEDVYEEDR